jgi:probable addiction module antidote protein
MTEKLTPWDAADDLKSEEDIALYLQACANDDPGDGGLVRAALGDIARFRGPNECVPETNSVVLDELNRRAVFRDTHPNQGKSLEAIAQSLGVKL